MREIKIKPTTKDLLVRDPITRVPLKASGEVKPRNAYWLRRILDDSVVEINSKKREGVTS